MSIIDRSDTIFALTTPRGQGAIGVIRVSGIDTFKVVQAIFSKKIISSKGYTSIFGQIIDGDKIIDEVILNFFINPHSFTGEDVIEISFHGSTFIEQRITELLLQNGARLAQAGEFSMRAFMNGKMDLSQAEAITDLIASSSEASHKIAMQQMRGGFSNELSHMREQLIDFAALIELELDFSEEDVEFADRTKLRELLSEIKDKLNSLVSSFSYGNAIKDGVPVVIAGKPNAGKSSLLNALLNEDKAIVSDIAGTTRDAIEDTFIYKGIKFRITDTAGLRDTDDTIEAIGVERAKDKVAKAKILLYLYNQTEDKLDEVVNDIKEFHRSDLIVIMIHNKVDLVGGYFENKFDEGLKSNLFTKGYSRSIQALSTKDIKSVEAIKESLFQEMDELSNDNDIVVSNSRHYEALKNALDSLMKVEEGMSIGLSGDLLAMDIRQVLHHIGSITGEVNTDDLLGSIFSRFCIGK